MPSFQCNDTSLPVGGANTPEIVNMINQSRLTLLATGTDTGSASPLYQRANNQGERCPVKLDNVIIEVLL